MKSCATFEKKLKFVLYLRIDSNFIGDSSEVYVKFLYQVIHLSQANQHNYTINCSSENM